MVVRQGEWQHQPRFERRAVPGRLLRSARDAEDRDLRPVDDRREGSAADAAEVGDGEPTPLHLVERQLAAARLFRGLGQLRRQLEDPLRVDIPHDRHEQTALCVGGDADVNRLFVDDLVSRLVDRRIELRKLLQRRSDDLQRDRGHRQLAAQLFGLGTVLLPEPFERGDVGLVVLRDMRDHVPGIAEMLRRFSADVAHRLTFDLAPFREVRERL